MSVGGLLNPHSQILRGPKPSHLLASRRLQVLVSPQGLATGIFLNKKVSTDWVESERFLSTLK